MVINTQKQTLGNISPHTPTKLFEDISSPPASSFSTSTPDSTGSYLNLSAGARSSKPQSSTTFTSQSSVDIMSDMLASDNTAHLPLPPSSIAASLSSETSFETRSDTSSTAAVTTNPAQPLNSVVVPPTFRQNAPFHPSDNFPAATKALDARQKRDRRAKQAITYTALGVVGRTRQKAEPQRGSATPQEVDAFLQTQVAPVSVSPRAKAMLEDVGIRNVAAGLGPTLDVGWGPLGEETEVQRERRMQMNLRYLRVGLKMSSGADGDTGVTADGRATRVDGTSPGVADGAGATYTASSMTRNDMFVHRLDGMFGVGSLDRGIVASKPKVSCVRVLAAPYAPMHTLPCYPDPSRI